MWFTFNKSMLPSIYHPYCCSCFRTDCFTNNSNNVLGTEFKLNALVWNHWIFCCSHLQVTAVHLNKLNNSSYSSSVFDITACVKVLRGSPTSYIQSIKALLLPQSAEGRTNLSAVFCAAWNTVGISNRKKKCFPAVTYPWVMITTGRTAML